MDDVDSSVTGTDSFIVHSPTSLDDPTTRSLYKNPLSLLTSFPSNPAPPHPTAFLSPFKAGSTSVVFHTVLKKPEIISFDINGEFHSNAHDVAAQFLAELRVYRAVGKHRNIVGFLGSVEGLGMILEYVEGVTLWEALKVRPEVGRGTKIEWFNQLVDGLSHLHSKGLSHGDLSLTNVYVTKGSSTIKLLDFGRSVDVRNFPSATKYGFSCKSVESDDDLEMKDEEEVLADGTASPFDDEDLPLRRRVPEGPLGRWVGGPERSNLDRSDWVGLGRGRNKVRPPSVERTPGSSTERTTRAPSLERHHGSSGRRPPSLERPHRMPFIPLLDRNPSSAHPLHPLVERALGEKARAGRSSFADRSPLVPKSERSSMSGSSYDRPPAYAERNSPRYGDRLFTQQAAPRYKNSIHHNQASPSSTPTLMHRHQRPNPPPPTQKSKRTPVETIHPGTRPFAAPEILRDECDDPILADAYSLGIMLVCIDIGQLIDLEVRAQREERPGLLDHFETTIFTNHIQGYTATKEFRSRIRVEDKMEVA